MAARLFSRLAAGCTLLACNATADRMHLGTTRGEPHLAQVSDAGEPRPPVSDGIACFKYIQAFCRRSAECRLLPAVAEGCLGLASSCPDSYFAPDNSRTSALLVACAAEYPTFPCDQFLRERRPTCTTFGALEDGQPCQRAGSCRSLRCEPDAEGQLRCVKRAQTGEACSPETACTAGNQCVEGRCQEIVELTIDTGNAPQSADGEPCFDDSSCQLDLFCQYDGASSQGLCRTPPRAGQPCEPERVFATGTSSAARCDAQSYCVEGRCETLPSVGQSCAQRPTGEVPVCQQGAYCELGVSSLDAASGVCVAWKGPGESCASEQSIDVRTGLEVAPQCDTNRSLRCSCPMAEPCDDVERRCMIGVVAGDPCNPSTTVCLYGAQCVDGLCDYPYANP